MKVISKKRTIKKSKKRAPKVSAKAKKPDAVVTDTQACTVADCPKACQSDSVERQNVLLQRINEVVSENARLKNESHMQRGVLEQAGGTIDDAMQRMEDILATLKVFCASNLGFDIEGYFESVESLAYPNQFAPEVPQQQVCAAAVTRLAVMLYATIINPERVGE